MTKWMICEIFLLGYIINSKIKLMSTDKYVESTLTMPSDMPLFNYNINFQGLRNLLQTVNISTNNNTEQIQNIKQQMATKLPSQQFLDLQKLIDTSLKFGLSTEKIVDQSETSSEKVQRKDIHLMDHFERYCWKIGRLTNVVEHLVNQTQQNTQKLNNNDRRHEKNIDESFRRIDEKVESSLEAMTKNINMYFTNTNQKLGELQTNIHGLKFDTENTVEQLKNELNKRVTENYLKNSLAGIDKQVKASLQEQMKNDHMKRLASLTQFSTKLKEHIKDNDIKSKAMKQNLKEMSEKVSKCFTSHNFELQRHKIYDKLSEFRSKIEDSLKRGQQFVDFRKVNLQNNERVKQGIMGLQDQIKKLREKGGTFQKMENIGSVLEALDPHLVCELSSEVKLHEKEIGKLEKQLLYFEKELQSARNEKTKMPEINSGQTSELVTRMIKQYMSNMDFDGRVKRAEKQIHDISRRSDGVNDLQKKLYMITKEMDMGMIMKEIKRKLDEDVGKRDIRIIDSKIEKLFDFYKQMRKQVEDLNKKSMRNIREGPDNASLATKRLYPTNCISCTPKQKRRTYSKNKGQMSLDESIDYIKHSIYTKNN